MGAFRLPTYFAISELQRAGAVERRRRVRQGMQLRPKLPSRSWTRSRRAITVAEGAVRARSRTPDGEATARRALAAAPETLEADARRGSPPRASASRVSGAAARALRAVASPSGVLDRARTAPSATVMALRDRVHDRLGSFGRNCIPCRTRLRRSTAPARCNSEIAK